MYLPIIQQILVKYSGSEVNAKSRLDVNKARATSLAALLP